MAQLTVVERLDKLLVSSESAHLKTLIYIHWLTVIVILSNTINSRIQAGHSKSWPGIPGCWSSYKFGIHLILWHTMNTGQEKDFIYEYKAFQLMLVRTVWKIFLNFRGDTTCDNDQTNSSQLDFLFSLNHGRGRHVWVLFVLYLAGGFLFWHNEQSTFISVNLMYVKTLNKTKEMYGRNPMNVKTSHLIFNFYN